MPKHQETQFDPIIPTWLFNENAHDAPYRPSTTSIPPLTLLIDSDSEEPISDSDSEEPISPRMSGHFPSFTTSKSFGTEDINKLSEDPYFRFPYSANTTIGHALIFNGSDGSKNAWQWGLPNGDESNLSIKPLHDIEEIKRFGKTQYMGFGPEGNVFYSTRTVHVKLESSTGGEKLEGDIAFFSKASKSRRGRPKEPFWGSSKRVKRFEEIPLEETEYVKGGHDMMLDAESIHYRDKHPKRNPSQNKVMGNKSARDAVEEYWFAEEV
jgi:hypothetical protein